MSMSLIASPFNYTGGKFKLLPQILPLFPHNINTFVDLCCGGGNVGINVPCKRVILNDSNNALISILKSFTTIPQQNIFDFIYSTIEHYRLSMVSQRGYAFYGCNSADGLSTYNRIPYNTLRTNVNANVESTNYPLLLYILIVYAFNNQMRFNRRGEFNLPVGKRDFNETIQYKLTHFIDKLQSIDVKCSCHTFTQIDLSTLNRDDFVYVDPPYLITCATYNEQNSWSVKEEKELYRFLDVLHERHIRFALSNVLTNKGKENVYLKEWLQQRPYYCHHLEYNYSNSNYHTSKGSCDEVLITNY